MTALFPTYHTPLSASDGANLLCATILGGGIARELTHYILDEYRAFQRCLRASLKGFAVCPLPDLPEGRRDTQPNRYGTYRNIRLSAILARDHHLCNAASAPFRLASACQPIGGALQQQEKVVLHLRYAGI